MGLRIVVDGRLAGTMIWHMVLNWSKGFVSWNTFSVTGSDLFGSEWSGSEGKSTPSTKIMVWRQERCGAPVSIYGTCTKLGWSRSSLILSSHDGTWYHVQSRVYIYRHVHIRPLLFLISFSAPPPYAHTYYYYIRLSYCLTRLSYYYIRYSTGALGAPKPWNPLHAGKKISRSTANADRLQPSTPKRIRSK